MDAQASIETGTSKKRILSRNPTSGEILLSFDALSEAEINTKLARAHNAFRRYRLSSMKERADRLLAVASVLENEKERWGALMSLEMGKLESAGIQEAEKCARACRYYAEHGEEFLAPESIQSSARKSFIAYQPLGTILAVMPWNFPFWQLIRCAAPALMAGNTVLLKHASNVPQCALALEEIFTRAGFTEGVFQTLLIGSTQVEQLLNDPRVVAVSLTGSENAGRQVASRAGKNLKKCVLELGGSDPFIVMPSVNVEQVVKMAVSARTINNGESCIAAKRFIVHEKIFAEFIEGFVAAMKALRVGDPADPSTQIGPMATESIADDLARQVEESVREGARLLTGGHRKKGPGYFFEPTVLSEISKRAPAYYEELFGPVGLVFRATSLKHAIDIANDSSFGLGSSLWSSDEAEHAQFIRDIEAGLAFVNAQVASDPRLPFGGVKNSGMGRELGRHGILEFVNIKTVWISDFDRPKELG